MTEPILPSDPGDATLSAGLGRDSPIRRFTMLAPGVTFAGRYRIEERLGAGGVGEVYRAFDQLGSVTVALKVLFPRGEESHPALARLQRELRIVRRLEHPGIVRVHDIGESDGLLYLVLDLLEGETLRARMKRERLSLEETLRISGEVLEALAVAHAHDVVHRDIKPANIFLSAQRAMLLDFGLARQANEAQLTATHDFLGTPEYVAPEQIKGGRDVGPAADVYSFGVVLWEMLAGSPPFHADSAAEVMIAHLQSDLPSLPVDRARGSVPLWLRETVLALLSKSATSRPHDAGVVLEMLRRRRGRAWWRRLWSAIVGTRRARQISTAAATVALLAVLTLVWFLPWRLYANDPLVEIQNLFGARLRTPQTPFLISDAAPRHPDRIWSREYLAMFADDSSRGERPRRFPLGVGVVDLLTGRVTPAPMAEGPSWTGTPAPYFPRFDDAYFGDSITPLPWPSDRGRAQHVAVYLHADDYPCAAVVFDELGAALMMLPHAGHLHRPLIVGDRNSLPDQQMIVFSGESLPLGNRPVLAAISLMDAPHGNQGLVPTPPFELKLSSIAFARLRYYVMVPGGRGINVSRDGEVLIADGGAAGTFRYDLRTGMPLDEPDKPANVAVWVENQAQLFQTLRVSNDLAGADKLAEAAFALSVFADRPQLSRSQRGVALARAAFFLRRSGDLKSALAFCERARDVEPAVMGHLRMQIDLLSRLGRWGDAAQAVTTAPQLIGGQAEVVRDLVVGGLFAGQVDGVQRLLQSAGTDPRTLNSYEGAAWGMLKVQSGAYDEAASIIETQREARTNATLAMLAAIANAERTQPDVRRAREFLAVAGDRKGEGRFLPMQALHQRLARLDGAPAPTEAEVQAEAHDQKSAARDDIVEAWWAMIGDRLRGR